MNLFRYTLILTILLPLSSLKPAQTTADIMYVDKEFNAFMRELSRGCQPPAGSSIKQPKVFRPQPPQSPPCPGAMTYRRPSMSSAASNKTPALPILTLTDTSINRELESIRRCVNELDATSKELGKFLSMFNKNNPDFEFAKKAEDSLNKCIALIREANSDALKNPQAINLDFFESIPTYWNELGYEPNLICRALEDCTKLYTKDVNLNIYRPVIARLLGKITTSIKVVVTLLRQKKQAS